MSPIVEYRYSLSSEAELVARLETEEGRLIAYAVILLVEIEGKRRTVRVYDNDRGVPHMHRFTRSGSKGRSTRVPASSASEGFTMTLAAVRNGFEEMIDAWRRS